eukprot:3385851-Ditylum_brightwellii.AAC.1
MDCGLGQQCNQGLGNVFKWFIGTFWDFYQRWTKCQGVVALANMNRNLTCWSEKAVLSPICPAEHLTHYTQYMAWKAISGFLNCSLGFRPAGTITTLFKFMCHMAGNIDTKKWKVLDHTYI